MDVLRRTAALVAVLAAAFASEAAQASDGAVVLTSTAPEIATGRALRHDETVTIPVGASIAVAVGQGRVIWVNGPYQGPMPDAEPMAPDLTARLIHAVTAHNRARSTGMFRNLGAPTAPAERRQDPTADDATPIGMLGPTIETPWLIDLSHPHEVVCVAKDGQSILERGALQTLEGVYIETDNDEKIAITMGENGASKVPTELAMVGRSLLVFYVHGSEFFWEAPIRLIEALPTTDTAAIAADMFAAGCRVQAFQLLDSLAKAAKTAEAP